MHPPIHHHASGGLFRRVFSGNRPIRGHAISIFGTILVLVIKKTAKEEFLCL